LFKLNEAAICGGRMFLSILMIFDPDRAWTRIAALGHKPFRVVWLHLVPMLLVVCGVEAYGLVHWGKVIRETGGRRLFEMNSVLTYEACYFGVSVLAVFLCAIFLRLLADTFQRRQRIAQALAVSAMGMGPVFLARLADAYPPVNPWLSWVVGAVVMVAVIYQGLPRVFHLDPAHALGTYMAGAMLMLLVTGMARVFMVLFVQPKLLVAVAAVR